MFKSPFEADLDIHSKFDSIVTSPEFPELESIVSQRNSENKHMDMPMSYGFGLAYRFTDEFTVSADIYRTEWGDFEITGKGENTSPITGLPSGESDIDATHQVRLGAEYLFIEPGYVIPVRAGTFYDPAPAEGSPDDYYGLSAGTGIAKGPFVFDIAYQFRWGNDVGESILQNLQFSQDVREHTVYASMIVHF